MKDKIKELDIELLHGVPVHLNDQAVDQILDLQIKEIEGLRKPSTTNSSDLLELEKNVIHNATLDSVISLLKGEA